MNGKSIAAAFCTALTMILCVLAPKLLGTAVLTAIGSSPTGFLGDWLVGVLSSIMGTLVLSMAYLFCRGTYLAYKRLFN